MRIAISDLTPVEPTAFVTQHARALDSRWPKPTLGPAVDLYPAAARVSTRLMGTTRSGAPATRILFYRF